MCGKGLTPSLTSFCAGRKGIGLGKRARSPNAAERQTKLAKADEEASHHDFRDRARDEYNERQAEARLRAYTYRLTMVTKMLIPKFL